MLLNFQLKTPKIRPKISFKCKKIFYRFMLGTRPRYNLVVDEDVKKPNQQTNKQIGSIWNELWSKMIINHALNTK